ncbi:hypothetical protein R3X27_25355, partial [Tropicimonas sp. TH_r6]|uniref:hypothetical protein n=1 Tax=Tropicimonas sp. TH_r6 TaxID=3082085 RepID=UPI002954398D
FSAIRRADLELQLPAFGDPPKAFEAHVECLMTSLAGVCWFGSCVAESADAARHYGAKNTTGT